MDDSSTRTVHRVASSAPSTTEVHFYLALYWADELAKQTADVDLASKFSEVAAQLAANEETIVKELLAVQVNKVDLGGYFHPNSEKVSGAMRPSQTLNQIVASLN